MMKKILQHRTAAVSILILAMIVSSAIFASVLAPYDPLQMGHGTFEAPGKEHLFGTDQLGRDILSRVIYGARASLLVGFLSVALSVCIGVAAGLISGYYGGVADSVCMRIADVFMSFPLLMLILVVVSIVGASLKNMILILGLLQWPALARLVRGNVLSVKQEGYIKACQIQGFSSGRIMFVHILPNIMRPILVSATFNIAKNILLESSLGFLGMGVPLPTPSWGNMLSGIRSWTMLTKYYWLWLPAGLAILVCVLAVNFLGDALMDIMNLQMDRNIYKKKGEANGRRTYKRK